MATCTAHSKRTGRPCKGRAVVGRSVCRMHGGTSLPPGPSHPAFRHGRMSRALPAHLRERYEQSLADPELLDLSAEIRLTDTLIEDAIARIGSGDSPYRWRELQDLIGAYEDGEVDNVLSLVVKIQKLVRSASFEADAYTELLRLLQMRRRLTDSENRRRLGIGAMISVQQALAFMTACVAIVERHISDKPTLAAIVTDLDRLADQSGDRTLSAAG